MYYWASKAQFLPLAPAQRNLPILRLAPANRRVNQNVPTLSVCLTKVCFSWSQLEKRPRLRLVPSSASEPFLFGILLN